jgi:hypothetical protein
MASAPQRFYRETLGLVLDHEDKFAAAFKAGGATLRVSFVAECTKRDECLSQAVSKRGSS